MRVVAAPARQRGERLRVGEDLRHRHLGADRRHARPPAPCRAAGRGAS